MSLLKKTITNLNYYHELKYTILPSLDIVYNQELK